MTPLVVHALVDARRGEPGADTLVVEALAIAVRSGEVQRLAPATAASAELAWLERSATGRAAPRHARPRALAR